MVALKGSIEADNNYEKGDIVFTSNDNKAIIVFKNCNYNAVVRGLNAFKESIITYAIDNNKWKENFNHNVNIVMYKIRASIIINIHCFKSISSITLCLICTFLKEKKEVEYKFVAPVLFPIGSIIQTI